MPRIRETPVAGTSYSRCDQMVVNIDDSGKVLVTLSEVDLLDIPGEARPRRERSGRTFTVELKGATEVPLVDPETWEPEGPTVTMNRIRRALIGLYVHLATA